MESADWGTGRGAYRWTLRWRVVLSNDRQGRGLRGWVVGVFEVVEAVALEDRSEGLWEERLAAWDTGAAPH